MVDELHGSECLNKILSASFKGCQDGCLHCGEVNETATRGLAGFKADRQTLQECLDATRVHIEVVDNFAADLAGMVDVCDAIDGMKITAAKLEAILK